MRTSELHYDRRRRDMPKHPAVLTCDMPDCTAAYSLPNAERHSDGELAAVFIAAGWELGRRATCPGHVAARETAR